MNIRVRDLAIYPVKSLPGILIQEGELFNEGFRFDRRWMLVDQTNNFVSLRTEPELYKIKQKINTDNGSIEFESSIGKATLPLYYTNAEYEEPAHIWKDSPNVIHLGTNEYFSEILGKKIGVCYMPEKRRQRFTEFDQQEFFVGFADAYPLLVLSFESLQFLYEEKAEDLWLRFRPNVLLEGCYPFQEDEIKSLVGHHTQISLIRKCVRCNVPPINPDTLQMEKYVGKVLNEKRRIETGVVLGMNAIIKKPGFIKKGEYLHAT